MTGWESWWHWVILGIVVFALFGYKKLPDAARSLGRSMRIFKAEIKGMREDDKAREEAEAGKPAEPRALPAAEVVKREADANEQQRARPRPSPSPNSRT
jgi:sec-independent protein translocase protein TatA